jgi:hypothetical protein
MGFLVAISLIQISTILLTAALYKVGGCAVDFCVGLVDVDRLDAADGDVYAALFAAALVGLRFV